jgi:arylsulfatase A-like enzyme
VIRSNLECGSLLPISTSLQAAASRLTPEIVPLDTNKGPTLVGVIVMKITTRLFLVALAIGNLPTVVCANGPSPNVVLMIGDDQAWTDYGFMGHPHIRTPNLDRLAREGLTFRRGYVPSSLCSPSLASILTGLYPHQHRITSNDPVAGGLRRASDQVSRLTDELIKNFERVPTLPRLLTEKGYLSLQTGKWWGGDYRHGGFTHGMSHGDPRRGGRHGDDGLKIGRETMQPVFDFIDQAAKGGKPFFVWYAPMLPHQPHNPAERLLKKYRGQASSLEVAKYWAMCEWFDETCGQLLDFLDARQLATDTIVIYLADNGWIQNPNADAYAPKSKQSPYDGGLRTPITIRWPGRIRPATSDRLAISLDLAPTILAAAGWKVPAEMPGISLLDSELVEKRNAIFGEIFTHDAVDIDRPASSLRYRWSIEGYWKLIVPAPQNTPDAAVELYDLAADPFEHDNQAQRDPARVRRLQTLLDQHWTGRE